MLQTLIIENFALIDYLETAFNPGLNIITGETGAGKSIIIGALGLILGERSRSDVVRKGCDRAVVEGIFLKPSYIDISTLDIDIDQTAHTIILRRVIAKNGRSRCFVNDEPVSLATLSTLGDLLVDLHGQHDHQTLLNATGHIEYLDNYGIDETLRQKVKSTYIQMTTLKNLLTDLKTKMSGIAERRDLLQFQLKEIEAVAPLVGEEEELLTTEKILNASEKIHTLSGQLNSMLYEGEGSVSEKLAVAAEKLSDLQNIDNKFKQWTQQCKDARIQVEEVVNDLQNFVNNHDFDPGTLHLTRDRLGKFSMLKKKYGGSLENVINFARDSKKELSGLDNLDQQIAEAATNLEVVRAELKQLAIHLSHKRTEQAVKLEKETVNTLRELGLENAVFKIAIKQVHEKISPLGIDQVEFFISLNPGEAPKPLKDIASGGEISRIMLALKTVLAEADRIPVMIFDEIDNGISGRIARVVGKNLEANSRLRQIICITHLPQIASLGTSHFQVSKTVENEHTRTEIKKLSQNDRIREIAKLLGGEELTESTLNNARELMEY